MVLVDIITPVDIVTQDVYVKATGLTGNNLKFMTFSDDSLVLQKKGSYHFCGSLSAQKTSGGTEDYTIALFKNGVEIPKTKGIQSFTNKPGYVGTSSILDLEVDDFLEVFINAHQAMQI